METVELRFEREVFSVDVLCRTAHRYTTDYYVEVQPEADTVYVRLEPKQAETCASDLASRFRNDALDDRLRATVSQQTESLQAALIQAALAEAQPRSGRDK